MKRIDLYITFTECFGNCIFCRKWKDTLLFKREDYVRNAFEYEYFEFKTESEIFSWLYEVDLTWVSVINISWNEPATWSKLTEFTKGIRRKWYTKSLNLRISNTIKIDKNILEDFDTIECSLYWYTPEIHNRITENAKSWEILEENTKFIQSSNTLLNMQTIFIYENIEYAEETIKRMLFYTNNRPIKIVYPYFIPRESISSLVPKTDLIKKLLLSIGHQYLKKCILVNFPRNNKLQRFFYDIQN